MPWAFACENTANEMLFLVYGPTWEARERPDLAEISISIFNKNPA